MKLGISIAEKFDAIYEIPPVSGKQVWGDGLGRMVRYQKMLFNLNYPIEP